MLRKMIWLHQQQHERCGQSCALCGFHIYYIMCDYVWSGDDGVDGTISVSLFDV